SLSITAPFVDRGDRMTGHKSDQLLAPGVEEWVGADHQRTRLLLKEQREGWLEIALVRRIRNDESNIDTCGSRLRLFQLIRSKRIGRIVENANGVGLRNQFAQ